MSPVVDCSPTASLVRVRMVMSSSWPKGLGGVERLFGAGAVGDQRGETMEAEDFAAGDCGQSITPEALFGAGGAGAKTCERRAYALARALMSLISRMGVG